MQVVFWRTWGVFPAHRSKQSGGRDLTRGLAWPFFTKPTQRGKVQLQIGVLYVNGLYRKTKLCTLEQYVQFQRSVRRERLRGAGNFISPIYRISVTFVALIVLQKLQVQGVILAIDMASESLQVGKAAGDFGGISRAMQEA